jgi:hypothetical protein
VVSVPDLLAAAMQELYAAHPDEFLAVRRRLAAEAKARGDSAVATEIGRLRKPTVAAWALNRAARDDPSLVERLVELGENMRDAQSRLDTATLTGLRPERDRLLVDAVAAAEAAATNAGRRLTPAAGQDVRSTVIAALADEQATRAVASGQLTRALTYSGFGEVDVSEAVARTSSGSILTVLPGRGAAAPSAPGGEPGTITDTGDTGDGEPPAPDENQLAEALEAAERAVARAGEAVERARERADETRERLAVVQRQLAKAREADERALEAVTDAVRERKAAEAARLEAEQALARAREGG